jgi:hypothetical protein
MVTPRRLTSAISASSSIVSLRVHAGGGLVEQQERGRARERPRDLEPALLAVG